MTSYPEKDVSLLQDGNVYAEIDTSLLPGVPGQRGPTGPTGATGAQGPSGVISVTSPITNSGTSTAANIGINQSLITLTASQIVGTAVITTDSRLSNSRVPISHASSHGLNGSDSITVAQSQVTNLVSDLAAKETPAGAQAKADAAQSAAIASANSYTNTSISNLVNAAPATLDTLNELATALGNDPNFATSVSSSIAGKVSLTGSYTNPSWLVSIPFTKISSTPTTLAGYGISDGITASTASLTYEPKITAGTTLQYLRGDKSLATFPTALSSFSNDSGYITTSALGPYLTSLTASNTYEPKITVGTTSQYWRGDKSWQTLASVATSGSYVDLSNKPTIPTVPTTVSSFTNDAGYITISSVPAASSTAPLINGTAAVGTSTTYARADHVHPTDTSRAALASSNTFTTGEQIIQTGATGNRGLVIKPVTGQTGLNIDIRNANDTGTTWSVDLSGNTRTAAVINPTTFNNSRIQMLSTGTVVDTSIAGNVPLLINNSNTTPTGNLTEWQSNSALVAYMGSGGAFRAAVLQTTSAAFDARVRNSGGEFTLLRSTAAAPNPTANYARFYVKDGTTGGTLKLVTITGASGVEETLFDNISSGTGTASAQIVAAGGVNTAGNVTAASLIKTGGTSTQILLANGSTANTTDFATATHTHGNITNTGTVTTAGTLGATPKLLIADSTTDKISVYTPSGTAGTTTFLRGDGTWATPAGGGGTSGSPFAVANVITGATPSYKYSLFTEELIVGSGAATAAAALYLQPFMLATTTAVKDLTIYVQTSAASSSARLGIYSSDASNYPSALVVDAGSVSTATIGSKTVTVTATSLTGGTLYWLAYLQVSGTPTLARVNIYNSFNPYVPQFQTYGASPSQGWIQNGVSPTTALPSTFTTTKTMASNMPIIYIGF